MFLLVLLLLSERAASQLSLSSIALTADVCFATLCNGSFAYNGVVNVTVGGFLSEVAQVSTSLSSSVMMGQFWLSWPICSVAYRLNFPNQTLVLVRPDLTVQMSNALFPALRLTALLDSPLCNLRPGFAYQRYQFVGSFNQRMSFLNYPYDSHRLTADFADLTYGLDTIRYVPEAVTTDVPALYVTGWNIDPQREWGVVNSVALPSANDPNGTLKEYARAQIALWITRGRLVYVWRMIPPIVVLVLTTILAGVLSFKEFKARLTLTITGLLSIVLMQYSFQWGAPLNLSYATRLDWLFFGVYLIQLLCLVQCFVIYVFLKEAQKKLDERERQKKRMKKSVESQFRFSTADPGFENPPGDLVHKRDVVAKLVKVRKYDLIFVLIMFLAALGVFLGMSLGEFGPDL